MKYQSPSDAGVLRHRVEHQRLTTAADGTGQPIETWTTLGTYWSQCTALLGKELVNAQAVRADLDFRVRLRYGPSIFPEDRFLFRGDALNIGSVLDWEGRHHTLECLATFSAIAPSALSSVYYGTSLLTSLSQGQVEALTSVQRTVRNWATTYTFPTGGFKFFAIPSSFGSVASARDIATGFEIDRQSAVTVGPYKVYRSTYVLGGAITVRFSAT